MTALLSAVGMSVMAGSSAMAFDDVDWDWTVKVNEHIKIDADIDVCVNPTGLVQVEKLQIFIGNATASSTVHDIHNYQYNPGYNVQTVPVLVFDGKGGDKGGPKPTYGKGKDGHDYDPKSPEFKTIQVPLVYSKAFDARVDLPSVVSAATAVGNNQSITSDVPVYLHDGQFVANTHFNNDDCYVCNGVAKVMPGGESEGGPMGGPHDGSNNNGNLHTTLAELFTLGAVVGVLTPSDISATSTVYDIKNASVDSSATAVANNINVTLQSSNPDNHVLVADITQFAYANVNAVSNVCDVSLHDYANLSPTDTSTDGNPLGSTLGRPIVSSVATAVGNNVNITVGVPAPSAP
jgi:hypothetical protein